MSPGLMELMAGNDAGWLLSFCEERSEGGKLRVNDATPALEIGRDEYYADIRAALPGGLEGGVYSFTIEGLSDEHYAKIAGGRAPVVKLYLYWRETLGGVAGALATLGGLTDLPGTIKSAQIPDAHVATLRVASITRRAGTRRYETTVTARERAFDVAAATPLCTAIDKPTEQAVKELLGTHSGFDDFTWHGATPNPLCPPAVAPSATPANVVLEQGQTVLSLLGRLGGQMEEASGNYGRGMFLIRKGRLHVGARPIPLEPGALPVDLTPEAGLVEVQPLAAVASDPSFDVCAGLKAGRRAPTRRQFQLTLKGRPDLLPGDLARFDAPPEETAGGGLPGVGSIGGPLSQSLVPQLGAPNFVQLYVASVEHRLSRTAGFVTTITGVEVSTVDYWDCHTTPSRNGHSASGGVAETQAGQAFRSATSELIEAKGWPEVAEVRTMVPETKGKLTAQTETLWRGLVPGDGERHGSRRLEIARPSPAPSSDAPYASPFAWGKCGLVLPRYPGTRVLVAHRKGHRDEPVDVGALWGPGTAQGPKSKEGDWWLILPVGAPTTPPTDEKTPPPAHKGQVTQDLTDAGGNRWIEVGELTVRIGTQQLKNAGDRPDDPADRGGLTIVHPESEAKIQIKSDGTVVIEAKQKLELLGKEGISIKAPDKTIDIQAKDVNVTVSNAMDVS